MDWNIILVKALRRMSEHGPSWMVGSALWLRVMAWFTNRHGMNVDSEYFRMVSAIRREGREPDEREREFIRNWWEIRYPEILRRAERHRRMSK